MKIETTNEEMYDKLIHLNETKICIVKTARKADITKILKTLNKKRECIQVKHSSEGTTMKIINPIKCGIYLHKKIDHINSYQNAVDETTFNRGVY